MAILSETNGVNYFKELLFTMNLSKNQKLNA